MFPAFQVQVDMRTAKDIGLEVAEEVRGFLTVSGIREIDFLKRAKTDHYALNRLRNGGSVNTGTIEKLYRTIVETPGFEDWTFRHELRDAVIMRAKAASKGQPDGLQGAVIDYEKWPRRGA